MEPNAALLDMLERVTRIARSGGGFEEIYGGNAEYENSKVIGSETGFQVRGFDYGQAASKDRRAHNSHQPGKTVLGLVRFSSLPSALRWRTRMAQPHCCSRSGTAPPPYPGRSASSHDPRRYACHAFALASSSSQTASCFFPVNLSYSATS